MRPLLVAVAVVSLASSASAQEPAAMVERGVELYLEADFENAIQVFEQALAVSDLPDDVALTAHRYQAVLLLATGDREGAQTHVRAALALDRDAVAPEGSSRETQVLFEEERAALGPEEVQEPLVTRPDPVVEPPPVEEPTSVPRWPAWALLGTGAGSLVAWMATAIRLNRLNDNGDFQTYRTLVNRGADACHEAQAGNTYESRGGSVQLTSHAADVCDKADVLEPLSLVFLGVGLAATTAGALWLILLPRPSEEAGVTLRPSVGLRAARLDLIVDL